MAKTMGKTYSDLFSVKHYGGKRVNKINVSKFAVRSTLKDVLCDKIDKEDDFALVLG